MRALVVSIWVFINLIFFGMCGYMYLLWSQYWLYMDKETESTPSTYDQQIFYYNRGYLPNETNKTQHLTHSKYSLKLTTKNNTSVTVIKNSKPRFPNLQDNDFELDTKKYRCWANESKQECKEKSKEYKEKILQQLRRVCLDESSVFKSGSENPYNVAYSGHKKSFLDEALEAILCALKRLEIRSLRKGDLPADSNLKAYFPKRSFGDGKKFKTCAVVASAGSLKGSKLGKVIDSHDVVLRFNHAPTANFEEDVGAKTTIRVLNSQVVAKDEFEFLKSDLYKNVTLIAWDPSNYTSNLIQWLEKPEYNFLPNYIQYRRKYRKGQFYLLDPRSLWKLWRFLQSYFVNRLRRNPPSSGFLGISLLLPLCDHVDVFEYIPSTRATKKCHYYDAEDNPACTFGVWHPLAAEKLLSYHLNVAEDITVFQRGYIRIPGYENLVC